MCRNAFVVDPSKNKDEGDDSVGEIKLNYVVIFH